MTNRLGQRIAGEITLSDHPGKTIRKWREEFGVSVQDLSKDMGVSPSVVSDYEAGRRKSPGTKTVKRIVESLLALDEASGSRTARTLGRESDDIILSIREFSGGIPAVDFLNEISGEPLTHTIPLDRSIHGFTVIDSLKAITALSSADYHQIYGYSSERALIFTGVKYGRSPMVAVRAHPLKPAMVVYLRPSRVDKLALKLAELERVILARTDMKLDPLIQRLEELEA
jgi:putative transcriptional regulator